MTRFMTRRAAALAVVLVAAAVAVAACNGYGSINIGGPYIGAGPFTISTGIGIGFPL
jgi:Na+/H+ antiporter NhaC